MSLKISVAHLEKYPRGLYGTLMPRLPRKYSASFQSLTGFALREGASSPNFHRSGRSRCVETKFEFRECYEIQNRKFRRKLLEESTKAFALFRQWQIQRSLITNYAAVPVNPLRCPPAFPLHPHPSGSRQKDSLLRRR